MQNFILSQQISTRVSDQILAACVRRPDMFRSGIKAYDDCDLDQLSPRLCQEYLAELDLVVAEYIKIYPEAAQTPLWRATIPRLQRYAPGQYYHELHCENPGSAEYRTRHLVYMTYLNTINGGGGTEWPQWQFQAESIQAQTLIWPAGWTHYHRGIPALEPKWIITGWFCFSDESTQSSAQS